MAEVAKVTALPSNLATTELGVSGSVNVATHIYEDFLPQLRGRQALGTYREMGDNDATIGSILFALEMLLRGVDWTVKPASEDPVDLAAAQFLEANVAGLHDPFTDTVGEMTGAAQYGFSFHETVYKRGDDGLLYWDRFAHRPQDSLLRWGVDEKNRAEIFVQQVPGGQHAVPIPLVKGIHFRIDTSTPSGKSMIRRAYRSWFFKKRTEEKLQIAVDRNLNGIPRFKVPLEVLLAGEGDARYDTFRKIVTRTRRDEQQGLLVPSDRDETGHLIYEFDLVSPDGDPKFMESVGVIRMYAADIAGVILAQFINLGRDAVGSRALAEPQQDLFQSSLEAILDSMQTTLTRQAVRPLFNLNPTILPEDRELPQLVPGKIKDVDVTQTFDALLKGAQSGVLWPVDDETFNQQLLDILGLETLTESVSRQGDET